MADYKHGTSSGYTYHKCRCDECKLWKKESSAKYYLKNVEEKREKSKAWYHANKERAQAARKAYAEAHAEEHRAYQAQYLKDNAEHVNRKNRDWRRRNKRRVWAYGWLERHRVRGGGISPEVDAWVKSLTDDMLCTYCSAPFETVDHIVPIASGGTNARANLTPSCHRCNRRKNSMSVEEFLHRLREEP